MARFRCRKPSFLVIVLILLTLAIAMACGGGGDDPTATSPAPTSTSPAPTDVPPTDVPPTDVPPTDVPPTDVPPTDVPPTDVPPTDVPPTDVPPTDVPPTDVPPTDVPPTDVPPTDTPPPPTIVVIPEDTQLLVAISSAPQETNLPWAMTESDLIQLRPMFEYLVDIDRNTGEPIDMLATGWNSSDGDTRWEFTLESGVDFHFEMGEFTAADVVHSVVMLSQEGSLQEDAAFWLDTLVTAEEVDSQTVAFNFNRAVDEDELIQFVSAEGSLAITSEAQFDDAGEAGLELEPAGTGPWQYISRESGGAIFYESVDDHWRKPPEFDKLEIRWEENEATRFASVVFGRYQITDLSEDLQITAAERGARLISGSVLSTAVAVTDPNTVLDYAFPGNIPGVFTHLEFVEAGVAEVEPPIGLPEETLTSRLVVGLSAPSQETNLPWAMTARDLVQLRPIFDYLVDIDRITGATAPMLASSWESADDDTQWTFNLIDGVPFHFGWGDFTAADVVHSVEMLTGVGSIQPDADFWDATLEGVVDAGNQTVVFTFNRSVSEEELLPLVSAEGSLVILSKAQFDEEGRTGIGAQPAGTGSWSYVERVTGVSILVEAVADHWNQTPGFDELQLNWGQADFTLLAGVLLGNVQIADLSETSQVVAADLGAELVEGTVDTSITVVIDPSMVEGYEFPGNLPGVFTHLEYVNPVAP